MTESVLPILYRDSHCVVINKPPALLVHRSSIDRHDTRAVVQMLRDQLEATVYPVHRLDKPTSGVLLFALSHEAARDFTAVFAAGHVRKHYLAVVRGAAPESGVIDHPLIEEPGDRSEVKKPAVSARTDFVAIATAELPIPSGPHSTSRYSLVDAIPHQGRRHQIRRHLKHISHPIIGDVNHGDGRHNRIFRQHFGCHRLLLHALQVELEHPMSGKPLRVEAPVDNDWRELMGRLGWSLDNVPQWEPSRPKGLGTSA